jgi:hypothetical protein
MDDGNSEDIAPLAAAKADASKSALTRIYFGQTAQPSAGQWYGFYYFTAQAGAPIDIQSTGSIKLYRVKPSGNWKLIATAQDELAGTISFGAVYVIQSAAPVTLLCDSSSDLACAVAGQPGDACLGGAGACDQGLFCQETDSFSCPGDTTPGVCALPSASCQPSPTCGCDGNVYDSPCAAHQMGVAVFHDGPCSTAGTVCANNADCAVTEYCQTASDGQCGSSGTCVSKVAACSDDGPICGCSGTNYQRRCDAAGTGDNIAHAGKCAPTAPQCASDSDCKGPLPSLCKVCSDGTTQCAHWSCQSGQCQTMVCPIAPPMPAPPGPAPH